MYRQLRTDRIVDTLQVLCHRIRERFPTASLGTVAQELLDFATETNACLERLRRPHRWLRAATVALVAGAVVLAVLMFRSLRVSMQIQSIGELVQGLDAAVNELILVTIAVVSLWTLEGRLKRREALGALHELRCLAHVIDMHQLTKDPDLIFGLAGATSSSPQRALTPFELWRYLGYCTELLSLVGKLAALHVQDLPDPVVLEAVNDLEAMTDGLARKIWQKLTLLQRSGPPVGDEPAGVPEAGRP